MSRRDRVHLRSTLVGAVLVLALGLGACSDPPPDPAQARQERVEKRLRSTFSAAQARCIIDRVDADVVRALDRTADLEADTEIMRSYSDAVAACVTDPTATTTTTSPATTTEPPTRATTSTTPGG